MNTNEKRALIKKVKSGQLTEVEYALFNELLQNEPNLYEETLWEDFLENELTTLQEEEHRTVAAKFVMPSTRKAAPGRKLWNNPYQIAIAATVLLLLLAAPLYWLLTEKTANYTLQKTEQIDIFPAVENRDGGLGYAEEGFPIGQLPAQWLESPKQEAHLSYVFCNDTLKLYINEKQQIDSLSKIISVRYESSTKAYFLNTRNRPSLRLEVCADIQTIIK